MPANSPSKERTKRYGIAHPQIPFQHRVGALDPRTIMTSHDLPPELHQTGRGQVARAIALQLPLQPPSVYALAIDVSGACCDERRVNIGIDLPVLDFSMSIHCEWTLARPSCSCDRADARPKSKPLSDGERRQFARLAGPDDFRALRSHRTEKGGGANTGVREKEKRIRLLGACRPEVIDSKYTQRDRRWVRRPRKEFAQARMEKRALVYHGSQPVTCAHSQHSPAVEDQPN